LNPEDLGLEAKQERLETNVSVPFLFELATELTILVLELSDLGKIRRRRLSRHLKSGTSVELEELSLLESPPKVF
jgi:hypothetical protein